MTGMTLRTIVAAMGLVVLAACTPPEQQAPFEVEQVHAIQVERTMQTRAVDVSDVDLVINEADIPALDAFISDFMASSDGVLLISVAVGAGGELVARERAATLMKHALKRGVRPGELRVRTHQPGAHGVDAGPIVLSYDSYRAIAPRCGDFSQEVAHNFPNIEHRNLGCSIQAAMAAQIANPADLVSPRTRQPSDTARKNLVLQNYRAGEPTPAELSPREDDSSIRALSQ